MSDFVHLHLHTEYSLLDGANKVTHLLERLKSFEIKACAITDHGNMFGVIEFYKKAKTAGIKPIIGSEFYLAPKGRMDRSERLSYHLVLIAKNNIGYKNLMKLATLAHLEGFYYNARIDYKTLEEYKEGLIGLSGCLSGEIPTHILNNRLDLAKEAATRYKKIFEPDSFYLEMQQNGMTDQEDVNTQLSVLSRELDIPLVATNDCHYLDKDYSKSHDVLLCIQTGKTIDDPKRMRKETNEFYIKSPSEMIEAFRDHPSAIRNTKKIADACNVEIELGKFHLPDFKVPEGYTKDIYLKQLAKEGLAERLKETKNVDHDLYAKRIEYELGMINKMGFSGYFLIVWDFIRFAKEKLIPVGPGRGSGAGSLVAYALKITDVDPLVYQLLFERFLNPERISMPDFDIDFCMNRRDEVIQYVMDKYGRNNVAQIITYGSLKAKGVVRDVGRVLGLPYGDVDKVAKMIPDLLDITLERAIELEPKLRETMQRERVYAELVAHALKLEGLNRHAGVHAAGIVISEKPLWEYVPLHRGTKGEVVTQFAKDELEDIGLIKFDFLGLKTLTVIDETVKLVNETRGDAYKLDISKILLDDKKVYQLLRTGKTLGIFQLESSGFRDLLKKLKPDCISDIIAAVALYRPGPLGSGMVEDFCKRKHKKNLIAYPHPALESILKETYGVIVYQEQVMSIASKLAGFSLGQADILRRAMGKKKPEEMQKLKIEFINGCNKNNIQKEKSQQIFDLMEYFAGYGFNKSHSTAYALISYQTAYLKKYFPIEFMAALLTSEKENSDKIVKYIDEASNLGINTLAPCINKSGVNFLREDDNIRFGLSAIKNIGENAAIEIVENRERKGEFKSIFDLCRRVDLRKVNKKVLESSVKCGAFDFAGLKRSQTFNVIEKAVNTGQRHQQDVASNQLNLFSVIPDYNTRDADRREIEDIPEWDSKELLSYEKELLGFYQSGHPLAKYVDKISRITDCKIGELISKKSRSQLTIAGVISSLKVKVTKKGEKMAFCKLEDMDGFCEVIVFPRAYTKYANFLEESIPMWVRGSLRIEEAPKILVNDIYPFDLVYKKIFNTVNLTLQKNDLDDKKLDELKDLIRKNKGERNVVLNIHTEDRKKISIKLSADLRVSPSDEFFKEVDALFGKPTFVIEPGKINMEAQH